MKNINEYLNNSSVVWIDTESVNTSYTDPGIFQIAMICEYYDFDRVAEWSPFGQQEGSYFNEFGQPLLHNGIISKESLRVTNQNIDSLYKHQTSCELYKKFIVRIYEWYLENNERKMFFAGHSVQCDILRLLSFEHLIRQQYYLEESELPIYQIKDFIDINNYFCLKNYIKKQQKKKLFPKHLSLSLQSLCQYYQVINEKQHDAWWDIWATHNVYNKL